MTLPITDTAGADRGGVRDAKRALRLQVLARRDGQELFISDVQEKTLHRDALARLWAEHAAQAREAARKEWDAAAAPVDASSPDPSGAGTTV